MRVRIFVAAAAASILILAVAIGAAAKILIARFDAIEVEQAAGKAVQAVRALEADLNQLAISAQDYGEWDDMYDYVASRDPGFLRANFSFASLERMQVDAVAIFDGGGNAVYSALTDEFNHTLVEIPATVLAEIEPARPHAAELSSRHSSERIIKTTQGLMGFAMVPIARSDRSDATAFILFFGRLLEADEVQRIRDTSLLPVNFAAADLLAPASQATQQADWPTIAGAAGALAIVKDSEHIIGRALIADWNGVPQGVVDVPVARDIGQLGRRTAALLMGGIGAMVALCTALGLLMLYRLRSHWERNASLEHQHNQVLASLDQSIAKCDEVEASLRENQSRLAHLTEHDSLTGLPNRQYLQGRLPKLLERMAADERSLALLYVDVDHFKNINDSSGHGLGDQLLRIIARRLRQSAGAEDIVLRMGGDEFVVVAPADSGAGDARTRARQLLATLRAPVVHEDMHFTLTASIGIAMYPQDGLDCEALLKHAEIALYRAKENGRNCYRLFATDMNVQLSERVLMEQALRRAINTEEIHIEYQPVVDLESGLLVSFEALARWRHPAMGAVPPGRFIPLAEETGLILPLGEQIVREVLAQLKRWQQEGLAVAPVAINVAPLQFERTDFANYVHETALEFDIDPRLVSFEVTESTLLQNSNSHIVAIDTLRHAGSRVYIDDFGTGFSNLSYLKTLPADALKIDQSFVRGIEKDANDVAIIASIVSMARQMGMDTIAEGIETAEQAQRLRVLGCNLGQGYYFSRPMAPELCRSLLQQLGANRQFTATVMTRAMNFAEAS